MALRNGGEAPTKWVVAGNFAEFRDYCESRGFSPYGVGERPFAYVFAVYSLHGVKGIKVALSGSYEARPDWAVLKEFIMKPRREYSLAEEPVIFRKT